MNNYTVVMKKQKAMRIVLIGMCLVMSVAACTRLDPGSVEIFSGERALSYVRQQLSFGPRIPGTPASEATRQWLEAELRSYGWLSERQCFIHQETELCNLIATHPDSFTPGAAVTMLGAHYDSRRFADQDPVSPDQPVPGANDGASGVAILLELARVFVPNASNGNLMLIFFDGEDQGHLSGWEWSVGAWHTAQALESLPDQVIIVDMVGDKDLNIYQERNSTHELSEDIWGVASALGFGGFYPEIKYTMIDDHIPFLSRGIDAVDIIDFDYPAWHTTADTLENVSSESLFQVGRTLQVWLQGQ